MAGAAAGAWWRAAPCWGMENRGCGGEGVRVAVLSEVVCEVEGIEWGNGEAEASCLVRSTGWGEGLYSKSACTAGLRPQQPARCKRPILPGAVDSVTPARRLIYGSITQKCMKLLSVAWNSQLVFQGHVDSGATHTRGAALEPGALIC